MTVFRFLNEDVHTDDRHHLVFTICKAVQNLASPKNGCVDATLKWSGLYSAV